MTNKLDIRDVNWVPLSDSSYLSGEYECLVGNEVLRDMFCCDETERDRSYQFGKPISYFQRQSFPRLVAISCPKMSMVTK